MPPPSPDMRSRRKGCHLCTGEVHTLEPNHQDHSTVSQVALQASKLRRLYALAHDTTITIATLAFGVAR
jgi:hypothetical protein